MRDKTRWLAHQLAHHLVKLWVIVSAVVIVAIAIEPYALIGLPFAFVWWYLISTGGAG